MNTRQPSLVERRMRFMPCTIEVSDSVAHARALLDERRIKHLPVMSSERLVGIVSARDLEARAFSAMHSSLAKALEMHPDRVRINSVMTADVRTVTPSDNLAYAAQLMRRKDIGALPVVEHGRLAGIITRSDLPDGLVPGARTKVGMIRRKSCRGARHSKPLTRLSPMRRTTDPLLLRTGAPLSRFRPRHSIKSRGSCRPFVWIRVASELSSIKLDTDGDIARSRHRD